MTANVTDRSFAVADDVHDSIQKAIVVVRNSPHNYSFSNCLNDNNNSQNETFSLELIDSSVEDVVCYLLAIHVVCCMFYCKYRSVK